MAKAGLVHQKVSQAVLLIIRKGPLGVSSITMALLAGKAASKCASRDVERFRGPSHWRPVCDRHKGVINFDFGIYLYDYEDNAWKKFGDENKFFRKVMLEYMWGGS